jgi:hypothetical protein
LDSNEPDELFNIKEIDSIFSTSYEMMIKEAFRADKNFILAKILTRSATQTLSVPTSQVDA